MTTYNPAQASQGVLFPCHGISIQFQTHKIGDVYSLNISQNQRSCDYFLGVPFNIASYALMTHMVAQVCGLEVGDFVHSFGDLHIYNDHLEQVNLQLTREPKKLCNIKLNKDITNIEDFTFDDIELIDYDCHPLIKGKVSV